MRRKILALGCCLALLPFDLIVALCVLVSLCSRNSRDAPRIREFRVRNSRIRGASLEFPLPATVIIVNWDGKHLLAESLPPLADAVRSAGGGHEILVVDNGSTDGSVDFIRRHYPAVRVLALDRNYGFAGGNNRGVAEAQTDVVVLLNNDMIVDRGFLPPLLAGFSDPSVFAVTSQVFFEDTKRRREETGKTRAKFEQGLFRLWHDEIRPEEESLESIPVFWAGGGSCAIDRRKYLEIGGFDSLYDPFYVEDTDLSYQAWKRGWKCLLAPSSRVIHKHRGTTRPKFGNRFVENTIRKNLFLLVWKNVTDFSMILDHIINLPRIHARSILQGGASFELRAYLRAIRQLPEAIRKKVRNAPHYAVSDREALARSGKA